MNLYHSERITLAISEQCCAETADALGVGYIPGGNL
jgi:hypothetical protein